MKAIILAGGLGTRLQSVVPDLPKPMAPIQGKPFLVYLIAYLKSQGFKQIILSVHHFHEKIRSYFDAHDQGLQIQYVLEDELLGTGGAMAYALEMSELITSNEPVFVLNGDTFLTLDYQSMYEQHIEAQSMLTIALRAMDDVSRYGRVVIDDQSCIVEFKEKGSIGAGLINAGVYLMQPNLFSSYLLGKKFSFEQDFLFPHLAEIKPYAFMAGEYFIDIGVPADYERAQQELALAAIAD